MAGYGTATNKTNVDPNTAQFEPGPGGTLPPRPSRLVVGLAVSLALHAALLLAWRQHQLKPSADDEPATRTIAVWLRPVPPPLEETVLPSDSAARAATQQPTVRPARRKTARSSELVALPDPSPGEAEPPDVFSVEPAAEPATGQRFDREAALRTARGMASEPDPARAGTAVGQIPPKPYATETKIARAIAGAKRSDCKDGIPGGLLAPLILLMDKKDSGCKW